MLKAAKTFRNMPTWKCIWSAFMACGKLSIFKPRCGKGGSESVLPIKTQLTFETYILRKKWHIFYSYCYFLNAKSLWIFED